MPCHSRTALPWARLALAASALLSLFAAGAQGQEVRHLMAGRFEVAAGQELMVSYAHRRAEGLDGLTRAPWPAAFDHVFVRAGGGQHNLA